MNKARFMLSFVFTPNGLFFVCIIPLSETIGRIDHFVHQVRDLCWSLRSCPIQLKEILKYFGNGKTRDRSRSLMMYPAGLSEKNEQWQRCSRVSTIPNWTYMYSVCDRCIFTLMESNFSTRRFVGYEDIEKRHQHKVF